MTRILVTGAAGFVGYHLAERLLTDGFDVLGVDNFNSYYDVSLKEARATRLTKHGRFHLRRGDLADRAFVETLFKEESPAIVVHLAAQAGVRYSLENPSAYVDSNLVGFANVLEGCRAVRPTHFIYASSSSVYGANTKVPFAVTDPVERPVSLYAATKRSNELMAEVYAHLFGLPSTGLRFFTVYGPWGRPDMAYFSFTSRLFRGEEIPIFAGGNLQRDFTYVSDIVESISRLISLPPSHSLEPSSSAHRILNIGASSPVTVNVFLDTLQRVTGRTARIRQEPMQPGDVVATYADVSALADLVDFTPVVSLEEGLGRFVEWYRAYFRIAD